MDPITSSSFQHFYGLAQETVRAGVSAGRARNADTVWSIWETYCVELGIDPFLETFTDKVPILQVLAQRVRIGELAAHGDPIRSRITEDYIRQVATTFPSVRTSDPWLNPYTTNLIYAFDMRNSQSCQIVGPSVGFLKSDVSVRCLRAAGANTLLLATVGQTIACRRRLQPRLQPNQSQHPAWPNLFAPPCRPTSWSHRCGLLLPSHPNTLPYGQMADRALRFRLGLGIRYLLQSNPDIWSSAGKRVVRLH